MTISKLAYLTTSLAFLTSILISPSTSALSASDWQANNIISDNSFTDTDSMSVSDIQNFLNNRVPACDTNGTLPATEYGRPDITHAQYAALNGWAGPPYVCLRNYYEVPKYTPGDYIPANNFSGSIPSGAKSAAQIIYDAAKLNNISAKTILVKIATESLGPLTSDTWPVQNQYTYAMGSHCPDSGPGGTANCDRNYAGFSMQVSSGAGLMRYYLDNMNQAWWPYKRPGGGVDLVKKDSKGTSLKDLCSDRIGLQNSNCVGWNVPASCRGTVLNIQTKATAALYTYTPYQPNKSALDNMYGTGDSCSAYGNRNFWRVWNIWFGSPRASFAPLDTPRWMRLKYDIQKKNLASGDSIGNTLATGMHLRIVDKIYLDSTWYFRTEFDSANKSYIGIRSDAFEEIPFEAFTQPRYMMLTSDTKKVNPVTGIDPGFQLFTNGTYALFNSKIYVSGKWYYRTAFDNDAARPIAFSSENLSPIIFTPLSSPRYMTVSPQAQFIDLTSNTVTRTTTQESDFLVVDKVYLNGKWYYQIKSDSDLANTVAAESSNFQDISTSPLAIPYDVKLHQPSTKFDLATTQSLTQFPLSTGQAVRVSSITTIDGQSYYISSYDQSAANNYGIKVADTTPASLPFIPLEQPRYMRLLSDTKKTKLLTGTTVDPVIATNTSLYFTSKVQIGYEWYMRTQYDTLQNNPTVIPLRSLQ